MKIGRFEITTWEYQAKRFILWEYTVGACNCRFLTICNVLFVLYSKMCEDANKT